jgi:hypothetical protein
VTDTVALLQEFYQEKLTELERHIAAARYIGDYDANNTYQYVINREETQLSWVAQAIVALGGEVSAATPSVSRDGGKGSEVARRIAEEDARDAQAFLDRWLPRVEGMDNARQRGMLRIILGETVEQKRFFEQAAAGNQNLLGTRTPAAGARVGSVLADRWIE